jgi:hypothetical protein
MNQLKVRDGSSLLLTAVKAGQDEELLTIA